MGKSILILLAAALSLSVHAPLVAAGSSSDTTTTTVTAFVLKGTSCQKSNADIDVSLDCEDNGGTCRLGDTAQVSGTVTFNSAPPGNVHVDSKACLFYFSGVKLGCYTVATLDESLCSYMKGYVYRIPYTVYRIPYTVYRIASSSITSRYEVMLRFFSQRTLRLTIRLVLLVQ
jgi:hypothetical protein